MNEPDERDQPKDREIGEQLLVHTPGPWTICKPYKGDSPIEAPHAMIGKVYDSESEEGRANARLIAAAPDLLAACRDVLDAIEQADLGGEVLWIKRGSPIHESASDRLQDVIERATCKPVV